MLVGTMVNGSRTHMVREPVRVQDYMYQRTECCKYGPPNSGIQVREGLPSEVDCLICKKTKNFRKASSV